MSGYNGSYAYNEVASQQDYMRAVFAILKSRWLSILSFTLLLAGVMAAAIQLLPKSYQGVASVEVLAKTPTVASPDIVTGDSVFTDETAGTELGIFNSQELRTRVIEKLNLLNNPEYNPDLNPSPLHNLLVEVEGSGSYQRLPSWVTRILPSTEPPSAEKELFDTVTTFNKKVDVKPVSHSKIIQVTATSRDPALAAQIANATVAQYVAAHEKQKADAYQQAYDFTNMRLPALRADMIAKSALADQFRAENDMVSGQYAAIRREKLSEVSKQLVDARARLSELKAALAEGRNGDIMNNPAVLSSQTIGRLREQEGQVRAEGAARPYQAATYALRMHSFENSIRAEAERVIQSLPNQVAAQEQAVRVQQQEMDSIQTEVGKMDKLQSQLDPLENDARIAAKQYTDFLTSDSVSRPELAFTAVNVRILSSAATPYEPHFPNKLMFPASFVLSFLCVTGVTLYRGRQVGFATLEQFKKVFQIEPIGRIPFRTKALEQAFWEALMFLSMKLSAPYDKTKQVILVTSAQPNEGKTLISMCLAEVFARRKLSVALVDADLRIARKVEPGQQPTIGLRDVLSEVVPLERAIVQQNGITVVNAGSSRIGDPASLLASDGMPLLLDTLRESHDIVIIDGPPAPVGGESWALSKLVDRVLCIVKQSDTDEDAIENAFRSLSKKPGEIDIVLNMVKLRDDPSLKYMQYYSAYPRYTPYNKG